MSDMPAMTLNYRFRNIALWIIIVLILIALFNLFQNTGTRDHIVSYDQFQTDVSSGNVRTTDITGARIIGTYDDMSTFQTYAPVDAALVKSLQSKGIQIRAYPSTVAPLETDKSP